MIQESVTELYISYPGKGDRLVRVFVPAHEEGETFPVIYMTDGQNLFDEKTAVWGCWHTIESVNDELKNNGKAAVIVGIHNDNEWRDNELTPAGIGEIIQAEDMVNFTAPEGEIFDSFVMNNVKPVIESRFPVKKGRENTAFCGSSLGGLQAFFTALKHPDDFCISGVFSPAFLLYSEDSMRRWIYSVLKENLPYLYIYTGAGDDLEQRIFQSVEQTYDILTECYPPEQLNEVVLFDRKHNEEAWEFVFKDFLHTFLTRFASL